MKKSFNKCMASRTILPSISALDARMNEDSVLNLEIASDLPRSKGILCFLNRSCRYFRSKSTTFQPVIMSGSLSSSSVLNFDKSSASEEQVKALGCFCFKRRVKYSPLYRVRQTISPVASLTSTSKEKTCRGMSQG